MFTSEHFVWIGICLAFVALMTYFSVRQRISFRTAAFIMATIALASEASKICSTMVFVNGINASDGMVLDPASLPLHLCSLLIFVFFYLPFCKNEPTRARLCSFFVPVGLIGATLAILMATSGTDFRTADAYQCFIYHAGMVWFALYLILTKQVELGTRAWVGNLLTLLCLAVGMIWVNSALRIYDANFWYVVRPPAEGLPLLNLEQGWYAYFGKLALCGAAGVTLVHLPGILRELRHRARV